MRNCLVPGAQKASVLAIMTGLFSPLATACGNIGLLSTIPFIINKHANHFMYHTYACAAQGLQQTLSSNQQSQRLKLNLEGSTMVTQDNCLSHYSFFFLSPSLPNIYSLFFFMFDFLWCQNTANLGFSTFQAPPTSQIKSENDPPAQVFPNYYHLSFLPLSKARVFVCTSICVRNSAN